MINQQINVMFNLCSGNERYAIELNSVKLNKYVNRDQYIKILKKTYFYYELNLVASAKPHQNPQN